LKTFYHITEGDSYGNQGKKERQETQAAEGQEGKEEIGKSK
jgi:hypothetical protein